MSFKLQDRIQRIKGLPKKYKGLLLAMASHARNDGTNIIAAKKTLADEMGVVRFTVSRNMDALLVAGLVVEAKTHVCRNDFCTKGSRHYTEHGNHWTQAYNINPVALQNVTPLPRKVASQNVQESRHILCESGVTICAAKQGLWNPASLGSEETSALTSGNAEVSKRVSEAERLPAEQQHIQNQKWLNGEPGTEEDGEEPTKFYWSERGRRELSIEEASIASLYLLELFPRSDLGEADAVLMAEIALDFQSRYPNTFQPDEDDYYANSVAECHTVVTMRSYLDWNREHKKDGMVHATVAEFHKAWFSDSDRSARIQWEDHDLSACPFCKRKAKVAAAPDDKDMVIASVGRGFDTEEPE